MRRYLGSLLLMLTALFLGVAAHATVVFEDGFEDGTLDAWPYQDIQGSCTNSVSTNQADSGTKSAKFTCANGTRGELEYRTGDQAGRFHFGTEYWTAYSIYFDQIPTNWGYIQQHHAVPNNTDWSTGAGPNGFTIYIEDGDIVFTGSTNAALVNTTPAHNGADWGEEVYYREAVATDVWYHIISNFKFAGDGSGFYNLWIQGTQRIDYTGVTTYLRDTDGDLRETYNYLKIGLYLGGGSGNIYYDNFRIGDANSSYAEIGGESPPAVMQCYEDVDGDLWSSGASETDVETCSTDYYIASALISITDDCDDTDADINPGELEICGNATDEDCSGVADACPVPGQSVIGSGTCVIGSGTMIVQ